MADPKQPVTVRLDNETHHRLKEMAKGGGTVSYLINQAVKMLLDGVASPIHKHNTERPAIVAEEVEAVIPVLKALGKPVHVDLFFELIETQQGR